MGTALVKIRSERDRMSAIERRIADFIIENAQLLRDYSSQQLANALGISQSSVVKFCQKLGFKGYPDLKLAISEAVIRADSNGGAAPSPQHAPAAAAQGHDLWLRKSEAEEATRLINPPGTLTAVAEAIGRAGTVVTVTRHSANPLRALADLALLVSAHDERAHLQQTLERIQSLLEP